MLWCGQEGMGQELEAAGQREEIGGWGDRERGRKREGGGAERE